MPSTRKFQGVKTFCGGPSQNQTDALPGKNIVFVHNFAQAGQICTMVTERVDGEGHGLSLVHRADLCLLEVGDEIDRVAHRHKDQEVGARLNELPFAQRPVADDTVDRSAYRRIFEIELCLFEIYLGPLQAGACRGLVVENDFDRDALDDLGEIAGGVFWRQQGELRASPRREAVDAAVKDTITDGREKLQCEAHKNPPSEI
jgi:hypothetical protein